MGKNKKIQTRYKRLLLSAGKCDLCGEGRADGAKLHLDHIRPRSRFPEETENPKNLQVLCERCNISKGNTDDTNWRANLRWYCQECGYLPETLSANCGKCRGALAETSLAALAEMKNEVSFMILCGNLKEHFGWGYFAGKPREGYRDYETVRIPTEAIELLGGYQ